MEDTNKKHVLMFSGGLDSYLALLVLLDNGITPQLVYVKHHSKNDKFQLRKAKMLAGLHKLKLIEDETVINLGKWEQENAFIPNRNGFLAMVGSLYGNRIYFAIMDGEQSYQDCKQTTFSALSIALSLLKGETVIVDSPFWDLTKNEVIQQLEPRWKNTLKLSYSCHNGTRRHCGKCSACFRRFVAFELNGIVEDWETHPAETELAKEYYEKAKNGHYGGKRDKEILEVLERYWGGSYEQ